jgi:hypothetical protein
MQSKPKHPVDAQESIQRCELIFFLVDESPKFIKLTFAQIQVAKEVTHHVVAM